MPYVAPLILSDDDEQQLHKLIKHAQNWRERQRAQTILWLAQGKSVAEIAILHDIVPETVRKHRRNWNRCKFISLQEGHRSGRPSVMTDEHQTTVLRWVQSTPLNAEQIKHQLHEQFQVLVDVQVIRKFLKKSGMVFKRTRHSLKKKRSETFWTSAKAH